MSFQNSKTAAINLLTMCRRAGRMVMGFDSAKDAVMTGKAYCVCIVKDLSPKTVKEIEFICTRDGIPILKLDAEMDEMWGALGKKVGILGICDGGFAKKLTELLSDI